MRASQILDPAREIVSRASALTLGARHPLERGEDVRPFFIVGSGRSGSTLLRRILQASPQLHVPPEMVALSEAIRVYQRRRALPWRRLVRTTLAAFERDAGFAAFGVPLGPLAERLSGAPAQTRSLAAILDGLYRFHGEQTRQRFERWGDKTPVNAFHLRSIRDVFPRAQIVHVLRDGVDAAYSYVQAGLQPDLQRAALRWRDSVAAVRAFARDHVGMCCEVRYEALVADPAAVVQRLCAVLGVGFDPAMLDARAHVAEMGDVAALAHHAAVRRPIRADSIGRGRRSLGARERALLARWIGPELSACGYAPAESADPPGA
ncbi:MAG: sulfotransferase [Deltaproteobacteria bacterium]|nr:MAG: sulfotransferase [Deltaproteobacteria bacterium]